jgi:shikimate kinase/3-dehydroquinate synthase
LIWAPSSHGDYPAIIGAGALDLWTSVREWFVVADQTALRLHHQLLPSSLVANENRLIEFVGGEANKTMGGAEQILSELVLREASRNDGIFAFGGGVVGDLAGFCAALYHRDGMPVVQAPTTLLAQVDSAYGGKTGVNLPEAKHQVGRYHMPGAVLADTRTLQTLPREELLSGFVEVIKTALLAGGELWELVRGTSCIDPAGLDRIIFDCAKTKIDIVAADEFERGRRAWLNLGHTIGHAIEVETGYVRYRHGEAIGLGLLAALRLSGAGALRDEVKDLLARLGLPTRLEAGHTEGVVRAVRRDKKRTPKGVGFVLLDTPGKPREGQDVGNNAIRAAVNELFAP